MSTQDSKKVAADADGIVIHRRGAPGGGWRRLLLGSAVLLVIAVGVAWLLRAAGLPTVDGAATRTAADVPVEAKTPAETPAAVLPHVAVNPRMVAVPSSPPAAADEPVAGIDPDDLANYISPDEPEPTMREVIEALNDAGIYSGLGAFNPPGTSPPLPGIAVPEDFALPEGYVRHHQVSDAGEPIEPILMFSPDFDFYDDAGQLIALPEDMVVPPELAPPGLPIRQVLVPPPP